MWKNVKINSSESTFLFLKLLSTVPIMADQVIVNSGV